MYGRKAFVIDFVPLVHQKPLAEHETVEIYSMRLLKAVLKGILETASEIHIAGDRYDGLFGHTDANGGIISQKGCTGCHQLRVTSYQFLLTLYKSFQSRVPCPPSPLSYGWQFSGQNIVPRVSSTSSLPSEYPQLFFKYSKSTSRTVNAFLDFVMFSVFVPESMTISPKEYNICVVRGHFP